MKMFFQRIMMTTFLWIQVLAGGCTSPPLENQLVPSSETVKAKVKVITLTPQAWQENIRTYGVIAAASEVNISVNFSETVSDVHFKIGDKIEYGQVLIDFNPAERSLFLNQARLAVADAKATLDKASKGLARRQKLAENGSVSRETLEAAEIMKRQVLARYRDALTRQRLAERELAESRLLSPAAGVIESRSVEPGEEVQPGQILATIQSRLSVKVKIHVSDRDVNYLRVGMFANVTSSALRGKVYTAKIESIGVKANPRTGNFPVKLTLTNNDSLLRVGMPVHVHMVGTTLEDILVIPNTALVDRGLHHVVYIVVDGVARKIEPLLKASSSDRVPVLEGLKFGDALITRGLEFVVDGSSVIVIED